MTFKEAKKECRRVGTAHATEGSTSMNNELPAIIHSAMVETVTNIGQLTKSELYQLNKYVKRGWLSKGKGGPFPMLKTVYAHPGYDFAGHRRAYVEEVMRLADIEKRLRANGYFDPQSPNYGKSLSDKEAKESK